MNPRRYRGFARVRFRAWVLPVVGGLAGGALVQWVGAVAFAPDDVRCEVVDVGDSVSLWLPVVSPNSNPGRWAAISSGGSGYVGPWSASSAAGPHATPSLSYDACSLPERVAWWISPELARRVEWPRIPVPYRKSDEVPAQGGRFALWTHRWGL